MLENFSPQFRPDHRRKDWSTLQNAGDLQISVSLEKLLSSYKSIRFTYSEPVRKFAIATVLSYDDEKIKSLLMIIFVMTCEWFWSESWQTPSEIRQILIVLSADAVTASVSCFFLLNQKSQQQMYPLCPSKILFGSPVETDQTIALRSSEPVKINSPDLSTAQQLTDLSCDWHVCSKNLDFLFFCKTPPIISRKIWRLLFSLFFATSDH